MELEESTYLTSGSTTKPQSSRQYGTGQITASHHQQFSTGLEVLAAKALAWILKFSVPILGCHLAECLLLTLLPQASSGKCKQKPQGAKQTLTLAWYLAFDQLSQRDHCSSDQRDVPYTQTGQTRGIPLAPWCHYVESKSSCLKQHPQKLQVQKKESICS